MLTSFWSGLGGEVAKQWAARVLTPAFAFWIGGLGAVWWSAHGAGVHAHGWSRELADFARPLEQLPALAQGLLVIGGLGVLAASALVADRVTLPVLRLLEGYWSRPRWLRRLLVARRRSRRAHWQERVDELSPRQRRGSLSVRDYGELLRLEADPAPDQQRLRRLRDARASGFDARQAFELARGLALLQRTPQRDALGMPTRLGDILRAAERRPFEKYGLDAAVCWIPLWLVLPAEVRTEIALSRSTLDGAARAWLWGVLFVVWTPWTLWALPIGALVALLAYNVGMLGAAAQFGELVVAAFDLYRMQLYDALHLPRPASPVEEPAHGHRVNNLLWGGLDDGDVRYVAGAEGS